MTQELYITKALEWFDVWAKEFMDTWDYHGFSISFAKGNDVVFSKGYGNVSQDNLFRMASHSKNITAVAIMKLVEQEKLMLDDKIIKHLDFLNPEDKGYQNITVRQVLNHSAGIKRDGYDARYWFLTKEFPQRDELKKFFKNSKTYVETNTKFKYSNLGYALLGLLIEKITGQDYDEYIQQNLFVELEDIAMSPRFIDRSKIAKGYTSKYVTGKPEVLNTDKETNTIAPAAGLIATTGAMCKFYQNLYYGNESVISDEDKKELFRSNFDMSSEDGIKYGLSFRSHYRKGQLQVGHTGGFPGCISATMVEPNEQFVISCASNDLNGLPLGILNTLLDFINFFKSHKDELEEHEEFDMKKPMVHLYANCFFIRVGNKLHSISSNYLIPFDDSETIEKDNSETLYKITKSPGRVGVENEEIELFFDDNKVIKTVNWAGYEMVRKEDFIIPE